MAICMCSRALLAFEEWMVFCGLPQCPLRSLVSLLALGGIELMSATTVCDPNCLPPVDRSSNSALVSLTPNLCASLASEHLHVPSSGHKGALRSPAGCGPSCPQALARMLSLLSPIPLYCLFSFFWIWCQLEYRVSRSLQPSLGYSHGSEPLPSISLCSPMLTWAFIYLTLQT